MIKLNDEQQTWLKENFALSKNDLPIDFITSKDWVETLSGLYNFRGIEHHNSNTEQLSFIEECILNVSGYGVDNKLRYQKLINQIVYLSRECEKLEYYELSQNIQELLDNFIIASETITFLETEDEVNSLLSNTNVTLSN
jgi:hypothetical protein